MPLWQPQWLNAAYKVRVLDEPQGIYGKGDTAFLLGHQGLQNKLTPQTLARLANIKLSIDAVTQMDLWVNADGLTPHEAARKWLVANPSTLRKKP
jgi:glycine betaine/proline transport system substrate-binding protein